MLNYAKLWLLLNERGLQRTDLTKQKVISSATLAKLGKNESVNSTVIERLCAFLKCQPGDIMEYVDKEQVIQSAQMMNEQLGQALQKISVVTGMSVEAMLEEFMKEAPQILDEMKKNPDKFDFVGVEKLKNDLENKQKKSPLRKGLF